MSNDAESAGRAALPDEEDPGHTSPARPVTLYQVSRQMSNDAEGAGRAALPIGDHPGQTSPARPVNAYQGGPESDAFEDGNAVYMDYDEFVQSTTKKNGSNKNSAVVCDKTTELKHIQGSQPLAAHQNIRVADIHSSHSQFLDGDSSDSEEDDIPYHPQYALQRWLQEESDSEENSWKLLDQLEMYTSTGVSMPPPNWTPPPPYPPQPIKRELPSDTGPPSGWKPSKAWLRHLDASSLSPPDTETSDPKPRERAPRFYKQLYKPPPLRDRYFGIGIGRDSDIMPPPRAPAPRAKVVKIELSELLKYGPHMRSPYTHQPAFVPPETPKKDRHHSQPVVPSPPSSPPTAPFQTAPTMLPPPPPRTPGTPALPIEQLPPTPPPPPRTPGTPVLPIAVLPPSPPPLPRMPRTPTLPIDFLPPLPPPPRTPHTPALPITLLPQSPPPPPTRFVPSPPPPPTRFVTSPPPSPTRFVPSLLLPPTRFAPSPLPPPTRFVPALPPSPTRFVPSPPPSPTRFGPSLLLPPTRFAPSPLPPPTRFVPASPPSPTQFVPSPTRFAPSPPPSATPFVPSLFLPPTRFVPMRFAPTLYPSSKGFVQSPLQFVQSPLQFVQSPLQFLPSPLQFASSPAPWFPPTPPCQMYGMPLMYMPCRGLVASPAPQRPPHLPREYMEREIGKSSLDWYDVTLSSNKLPLGCGRLN